MKTRIICNCISVVVAFLCITLAAFYFDKIGLLIFYLLPFIMFFGIVDKKEGEHNAEN